MQRCLSGTAVCVALFTWGQSLSAQGGSICGTVHDEKGGLASHIRVQAFYLGAHSGPEDRTVTNAEGRYCMVGIQPGEYMLTADDAAKGYPDLAATFYWPTTFETTVTISVGSPRAVVNWSIPYKAATLHVVAHDRITGEPVQAIGIELVVGGSEKTRRNQGSFQNNTVLLPPNEDVLVKVSAGGYRPWPSDQPQGKSVALPPGAERTLDVTLEPFTPK